MDNNRRRFFGGLGVLGAAVVGIGVPVTAVSVFAMTNRKKDAPDNSSQATLKLMNQNGTNSVNLSVGKDNMLWIKTNDEWKRLAVES